MSIQVKQLDQVGLAAFVASSLSGNSFSGILISYVNASGYLGPNVAYISGGAQTFLGNMTFAISPSLPYTGQSGQATAKRYIDDLVMNSLANYSGWSANTYIDLTGNQAIGGTKSFTGSLTINVPTLVSHATTLGYVTGISGVLQTLINNVSVSNVVTLAGDQTISGVKTFTGSPLVPAPSTPSGVVNLSYLSGVSGTLAANQGSTTITGNVVFTTGDQIISGFKIFTGSPWVASPTQPSGAVNVNYLSGVSGSLNALILSISGGVSGVPGPSGVSGASGASIVGPAGPLGSISLSGITGNFVNISFYFDSTTLATGLNLFEGFVSREFYFTGYGLGAINSGTQGYLSGSFYQRSPTNVKTSFAAFSLFSGNYSAFTGGFMQLISGLNRIGVDINLIGTGITGLTIGAFGVGY